MADRTVRFRVVTDGTAQAAREFDAIGGAADGLTGKLDQIALKAAPAIAAIGAAAAGVKALFGIGGEIDGAVDNLAVKTGAVGKQLDGLTESFKRVARDTPADFAAVSDAVAGLSSRLQLTGKPLEDLSRQLLDLSRITGTDVTANVEKLSRYLGDAGVPVGEMGAAIDKLFAASQTTGVEFDRLADLAVKFGAPMRQLGFDIDETTAMLAKFEREGVNTELVMGSLRIALAKMAKGTVGDEGIADVGERFRDLIDDIKSLKDPAEATTEAINAFGAKAGPDMAAAIREGRLSIDDLVATLRSSQTSITETADRTADSAEKWKEATNKIKLAVEPLASTVFDLAGNAADLANKGIGALADAYEKGGWSAVGQAIQKGLGDALGKIDWGKVGAGAQAAAAWVRDDFAPGLGKALGEIPRIIGDWFAEPGNVAAVAKGFGTIVLGFMKWVNVDMPVAIGGFLVEFTKGLVAGFAGVAEGIGKALGDAGVSFVSWIGDTAAAIPAELAEWTASFVEWVRSLPGKLKDEAKEAAGAIIDFLNPFSDVDRTAKWGELSPAARKGFEKIAQDAGNILAEGMAGGTARLADPSIIGTIGDNLLRALNAIPDDKKTVQLKVTPADKDEIDRIASHMSTGATSALAEPPNHVKVVVDQPDLDNKTKGAVANAVIAASTDPGMPPVKPSVDAGAIAADMMTATEAGVQAVNAAQPFVTIGAFIDSANAIAQAEALVASIQSAVEGAVGSGIAAAVAGASGSSGSSINGPIPAGFAIAYGADGKPVLVPKATPPKPGGGYSGTTPTGFGPNGEIVSVPNTPTINPYANWGGPPGFNPYGANPSPIFWGGGPPKSPAPTPAWTSPTAAAATYKPSTGTSSTGTSSTSTYTPSAGYSGGGGDTVVNGDQVQNINLGGVAVTIATNLELNSQTARRLAEQIQYELETLVRSRGAVTAEGAWRVVAR